MANLTNLHPKLVEYIKHHEGCELAAYKDSKGIWTIGYGHNLQSAPPIYADKYKQADGSFDYTGLRISPQQADTYLADDILEARRLTEGTEEWQAMNTAARQNALIELIFNMGVGRIPKDGMPGRGFLSFVRTRQAMRDQNWTKVAEGLRTSKWYKDVKAGRGERIIKLFETGWYRDGVAGGVLKA